jgi:hypothetical protein
LLDDLSDFARALAFATAILLRFVQLDGIRPATTASRRNLVGGPFYFDSSFPETRPMSYETFELRFEGCNHTMKIPLVHKDDDSRCFVCNPELRNVPTPGKCPACISAARHEKNARGAGA